MILSLVLAATVLPATEWAHEEFTNYTTRVFGAAPEVRFVLPGETADFADDFKALKDTDGYAVRTRDGKVFFVADNPRGHVNGVHRWLERNSDIIWPRPAKDICFFTKRRDAASPAFSSDYIDIPAFRQRYFGFESTDPEVVRWRARNALGTLVRPDILKPQELEMMRRYGVYGAFDDYYGYGHDMERLWLPRTDYLKDHPEWYMLVDGKRGAGPSCNFCETNPELPEAYAKIVLEKVAKLPGTVRTILVCMQDTSLTCQCPECLKPIRLDDGTVVRPDDPAFKSTRFFIFFNKIARLIGAKRPDLTIRQFAYLHLAIPPKVKIEPNVELMYCPFPRDMKEGIASGASTGDWRRRTEEWNRVTKSLFLYEYYFDGGLFPRPIGDTVAEDLRYFAAHGVRRVSWEAPDRFGDRPSELLRGSRLPSSWFFDMSGMEAWVVGKLAWDPSLDPKALRREYLKRTFGPAAEAVGEFYALVHAAWAADKTPSRYDDNVFETAARHLVLTGVAEKCRGALEKAARLADRPERREWIAAMREILGKWVREASNYADVEVEIPTADGEFPATFPELRLSGTKLCFARKDATVRIRVFDGTLEAVAAVRSPYVDGESADISFAAADGKPQTFPLPVTRKGKTGWIAASRIPLDRLSFDPRKVGAFRCLPRVWLKEGEKATALDFTWLGARLEKPETWGRVRLAAPKILPAGADETARWQAAIDATARKGGGRVSVPAGRHFVGQLDLRSNVELHLEEGAVLEALPDRRLYRFMSLPFSEGDWSAILFAQNVTNVAVTGKGEIFGNGSVWLIPSDYTGMIEGIRPRGLFFADSKDIRLEDFTLRDAPCWGVVFKRCDGVTARRVVIDSHVNHNNDGFDVEAKNVLIEDCLADAGDDAFCIKSNDPDFTVEHVRVRNCTARSQCNGYKLGTASHGTMRDIRFEHCRAEPPTRLARETKLYEPLFGEPLFLRPGFDGFAAGVGLGAITIENVDGGVVEDISATDFEVSGFHVPVFVRAGRRRGRKCGIPPSDKCVFRNVTVENVRGRAESVFASSVSGVDACRVQNVTLRNVTIACRGAGAAESEKARTMKVPDRSERYPECTMFRPSILPAYGLYADRVDGLRLENVNFTLQEGTVDVRPPVFIEPTVTDVERK